MRKSRAACASALLLSACASHTLVTPVGPAYPPKPDDCAIAIFDKTAPAGPYEVVGKIESHLERDYFFGGSVALQDQYAELKQRACRLGGDVIVIQDHIESSAAEMSHVHVWATVLKAARP